MKLNLQLIYNLFERNEYLERSYMTVTQFKYNNCTDTLASKNNFFRSPEILLNSKIITYSTDMWSFGCMLAGWIFRKNVFFRNIEDEANKASQIVTIARVRELSTYVNQFRRYLRCLLILQTLGHKDLSDFIRAYHLHDPLSVETKSRLPEEAIPWAAMMTRTHSYSTYATDEVLDLLSRILVYDPKTRISAKDALLHPYFKSLNKNAFVRITDFYQYLMQSKNNAALVKYKQSF